MPKTCHFCFAGIVPITNPEEYTSELPSPTNLGDFIPVGQSSSVFLKQKQELEHKSATIDQLTKDIAKLKIKNETLAKDHAIQQDKLSTMKEAYEQRDDVHHLKAEVEVLKARITRLKNDKKAMHHRFRSSQSQKVLTKKEKADIVTKFLSPYLSPAQIATMMRKDWKRIRNWTHEDYEFALTLRLLSRKTYKFLRDSKCIPLPGFSTLKKYFKDFQIGEGLFDNVMDVLKIHAKTLSPKEKIANLSFDEVHVKSDISWNPSSDQIVGPHSEANTMMIRLMFKKLKIPIWFRFDTALNKDELFKIITKIEEVGYNVKTITCDMGPKNRGLATQLGIFVDTENPDKSKTWFKNPARPDSKIFWFYDIPHLVKLCRNNLQTYGVELPSGAKITKDDINGIKDHVDQSTTIPSNSKLRKSEIYNVKALDKQKVCMCNSYFIVLIILINVYNVFSL